jgi:hypothetical protein
VVAIDGTKVHANASQHATRSYEEIAREILVEADAVDAAEDEQFGERRGRLREAKRRLDEKRAERRGRSRVRSPIPALASSVSVALTIGPRWPKPGFRRSPGCRRSPPRR